MMSIHAAHAQQERWQREGWKTDFEKSSVRFSEIMSGGPPRDGIPPIDDPKFVAVSKASGVADREPVIGLAVDGDARAYPLSILTWHEIVNDKVGGKSVVVTFCPLCNAALVFDATVDGKVLDFGTTGKLRNSDLIMYDRQTDSWWQQFVGEGIVGIHTGKKLKIVPSRLESWVDFKTRHPKGKVLVPNRPGLRDYGRNPYVNYDEAARPFLFRGALPEDIPAMARVVVVRDARLKKPYVVAMKKVREAGSLSHKGLKLSWKPGQASALGASTIAKAKDVGSIIVTRTANGRTVDVAYDVTFAFVAHAFHPDVKIDQ
ncbi:MAG: DUF3179 domain-containing protein [Pseudomonadota bacterium]